MIQIHMVIGHPAKAPIGILKKNQTHRLERIDLDADDNDDV